MNSNLFGRTGLSVSRLGFGSGPVGFLETKQSQTDRVVGQLLDAGVSFFDTAACYAGGEAALGHALKGRREDVVLATKAGHRLDNDTHDHPEFSPDLIAASIDRSLRLLHTDHLDLVLLHSCDLRTLKEGEALDALVAARDAGKIRFVGYSGDNEAAAFAAADDRVDALEMSVNLVDQANLNAVLPLTREHDKGVIAKRPIANACWKDLSSQPGMYANYAKEYTRRLEAMRSHGLTPEALGHSGHPEVEWPDIALRFTLSQPGVHVAIAGTTSTVHTEMNLDAERKNDLREEAVDRIRAAFDSAEAADDADAWPSLT